MKAKLETPEEIKQELRCQRRAVAAAGLSRIELVISPTHPCHKFYCSCLCSMVNGRTTRQNNFFFHVFDGFCSFHKLVCQRSVGHECIQGCE